MQRPVGVVVTLGLIGAALVAFPSPAAARGRCADYATQEAAQADLPYYPSLDGDHDGVACAHVAPRDPGRHRHGDPGALRDRPDGLGHAALPRILPPPT